MSDRIRSGRLDLVWLSPEIISALLAGRPDEAERIGGFTVYPGFPNEPDARFLAVRLRQMTQDPPGGRWLVRAIVLRETGDMIGHLGFHGPPGVNALRAPDAVEVGYTTFPEHRRQGYATEAVRALLEWAHEQGIARFVASVGPENEPSLRLVRRLGFVEVGRHWDEEDGEELEFVLG